MRIAGHACDSALSAVIDHVASVDSSATVQLTRLLGKIRAVRKLEEEETEAGTRQVKRGTQNLTHVALRKREE